MATAIPSLVVGLIAGVFVDRYDRRRIMFWSNVLQALLVALIPFVISINVLGIYVVILLNAGVKQFFDPAYESLIPDIATDEELAAANSLLQIASFGSNAIGFAGAGLLASVFDISWAFWIDSLTFVVSAICIWFVRVPKNAAPEEETTVGVVVANSQGGRRDAARHAHPAHPVPPRVADTSSRSACGTCCCCRSRSGSCTPASSRTACRRPSRRSGS